jgi:WhiB family transcriptional regulator, redox-sensing transcriptional regulator
VSAMADPNELGWQERGACHNSDPGMFFSTDDLAVETAKSVCATCSVVQECIEYAIIYRIDYGVWGGTDADERRRILRLRLRKRGRS